MSADLPKPNNRQVSQQAQSKDQAIGSPSGEAELADFCCPAPWEAPLGQLIIGDVTTTAGIPGAEGSGYLGFQQQFVDDAGQSIGNLPAGTYVVRYCRGAYQGLTNESMTPQLRWVVTRNPPDMVTFNRIRVKYNWDLTNPSYSGAVEADFNEPAPPVGAYGSYEDCEKGLLAQGVGVYASFNHTDPSKSIVVEWTDYYTPLDNQNASPKPDRTNPVFVLSRVRPWFTNARVQFSYLGSTSPRWRCTVTLFYPVPFAFTGLTAALRNETGISNASGAVSIDASAVGNKSCVFTCDLDGTHSGTAVVDVRWNGDLLQTFRLQFAPLLAVSTSPSQTYYYASSSYFCGVHNPTRLEMRIYNLGNVDSISPLAYVIPGTGMANVKQEPSCTPGTPLVLTVQGGGTIIAPGNYGYVYMVMMDTVPTGTNRVGASIYAAETGITYPTWTGQIHRYGT